MLELPAGAFEPFGWTAYHRPPYVLMPFPVTSPRARVRRVGVQRAPSVVTCVDPSLRLVVPSFEAMTPLPAVGFPLVVTGGHTLAHAPLQLDIPLESLANT